MNKKIAKSIGVLLLLTAVAVTQVPAGDVQASVLSSDFQMEGTKLLKYTGTAEVVSVPDGVKIVGEEAFAGNDHLVNVTIGAEVETVGYRAFANCDNLRTVTVEDGVSLIDTAAFSNNKELQNVSIGAGVRDFGTGVFAGCNRLADLSVSVGNSYLHYSNGVLYDDAETIIYALMPAYEKEAYTVPGTVKEIRGYAFWGNPYLERVVLGSGLYEIPAYAFSNCLNLQEVEIPLPVHGIGSKAFEDCVNLQTVEIPDSMMRISDSAFDGCPRVELNATPGTYGAEFAAQLQKSEVDEVEYEDVQDSQVIEAEDVSGESNSEGEEPEEVPSPSPEPTIGVETQTINNLTLLGQSSIVSGRAVVFIDNRQSNVINGSRSAGAAQGGRVDLSQMSALPEDENNISENAGVENLLADRAQKGKDFPKYTVVGDSKIAAQAFYQDRDLKEYQIDEGIQEIGEFAFARSGLTSVTIPEGVTSIGYGAFYHCDSLEEVSIPSTVIEIDAYAFEKTPWVQEVNASSPYKIVGDGILVAYGGSDSVVNIPEEVKQIGPLAFKDHMGITAVNIPASVRVIGEGAFMDCKNLKTVNGGTGVIRIEDRAFMNCPLSSVTIHPAVEEIGLGAFAISGGTDTVVFEGSVLPKLIIGDRAGRLANNEYRTYAFDHIRRAVIQDSTESLEGTVLEAGTFGFHGIIYNESGSQIADNTSGVTYEEEGGVSLEINSRVIKEGENQMVTLPGEDGSYLLQVMDSDVAGERITAAYGELYGGREPSNLTAYEISLYDASGIIPITRLGKQYATIQFKVPEGASPENLHVVTLDQDGQLEAVEHRIVQLEDGDYLQFVVSHFSPFGIYNYSEMYGQAYVSNGSAVITSLSGNKDNTPDTGDPIHPKWFLASGLLAAAIAMFFYKGKSKKTNKV